MAEDSPTSGEGNHAVQADMPHQAAGPHDVFVSYASQDVAIANAVVAALERGGITCWIAPRDVVPGALYADGIIRAINDAKVLVLVLSASSIASKHVGKEVERASSKGRPIITLKVDAAPLTTALEYFLSESQWIEVVAGDTGTAAVKMTEAVRRHLHPSAAMESRVRPDPPTVAPQGKVLGRWIVAAGVAVVVCALAYLAANKFWMSKRVGDEKPVAAVVTAAVPAPPAIPEKSVAVLPFVDMSEKKDQEYFSDGMSEELIDMLTKIPDLRVPARTSSFYFKGRSEDIPTIARRLLVAHVLEGSVRKSGRNLRITVQLVRADNGYHLWSETYDRTLDDTFKIQDEIADAVVKALKVSLFAAAVPRAAVTSNTDAYTLYLRGRAIFMRADTLAELENAADYFRRAIKDDPTFATAWAYLSRVHMWEWDAGFAGIQVASVDGRQEAERALALDPNLSQAHVALGSIYVGLDWNWVAAAAEFKKALEIDPGDTSAMQFSAYLTLLLGGHDDTAQKLYLRSIELNPIDETFYSGIANFYFATGNLSGAEAALRKGLDLRPTAWGYHYRLALSRLERGDPAQALVECGLEPEETAHRMCLTLAYYGAGRKAESDAALSELETKDAADAAFSIAEVRAYRGENDRAFAWLDRAYHQHDTGLPVVSRDALLKNLKSDPRYKALLRKMKLPE